MSVIVVTDEYETIRPLMCKLQAQTVRDELEVVLVAPNAEGLGLRDGELESFHGVRRVDVGPAVSLPWARAAGIRKARAPLVVLTESHAFPAPEWAEHLIAAHRGPWVAVGPAVSNGNPGSLIGWTNLLLDYGPWLEPVRRGPVGNLPGHNSSYKREALLAYGGELEGLLEVEVVMHWDLVAKGFPLYVEPSAVVRHVNVTLPVSWIRERYHSGRVLGGARSRRWSSLLRLSFVVVSPLIPVIRLWRTLRELLRPGRPAYLIPGVLPLLVVSLVIQSFGELVGYALGSGRSLGALASMELHRFNHLAGRGRVRDRVRQLRERG